MSYKKIQNYMNVEGIQTDIGNLSTSVETLETTKLSKTTEIMLVYADGDNGDDANDGLSWTTAKKTLAAAWSLIPDVVSRSFHAWMLLKGTFTSADNSTYAYLSGKTLYDNIYIVGDFDSDDTILGPLTADIGSTSTFGLSSLTMTEDEYAGYQMEILDGTYAGYRRTVVKNTGTTFYVNRIFPGSVNGASFRLYKPATTLQCVLICQNLGTSALYIEGVTFEADIYCYPGLATISFSHSVVNNTSAIPIFVATTRFGTTYYSRYPDPVTKAFTARNSTQYFLGIGILNKKKLKITEGSVLVGLNASSFGAIEISSCFTGRDVFGYGSRINNGLIWTNTDIPYGNYLINANTTYGTHDIVAGGTNSIYINNSKVTIGGNRNVEVSGAISHGIVVEGSSLTISRVITGSHGGAGLYARRQSYVETTNGQRPILSGPIGDITTDGTNPTGSWADVDAGSVISDVERGTIIREGA